MVRPIASPKSTLSNQLRRIRVKGRKVRENKKALEYLCEALKSPEKVFILDIWIGRPEARLARKKTSALLAADVSDLDDGRHRRGHQGEKKLIYFWLLVSRRASHVQQQQQQHLDLQTEGGRGKKEKIKMEGEGEKRKLFQWMQHFCSFFLDATKLFFAPHLSCQSPMNGSSFIWSGSNSPFVVQSSA